MIKWSLLIYEIYKGSGIIDGIHHEMEITNLRNNWNYKSVEYMIEEALSMITQKTQVP